MIHDIKPYPDRDTARVAWIFAKMVSKWGKSIEISTESLSERQKRIEGYWLYDDEQYRKFGNYES